MMLELLWKCTLQEIVMCVCVYSRIWLPISGVPNAVVVTNAYGQNGSSAAGMFVWFPPAVEVTEVVGCGAAVSGCPTSGAAVLTLRGRGFDAAAAAGAIVGGAPCASTEFRSAAEMRLAGCAGAGANRSVALVTPIQAVVTIEAAVSWDPSILTMKFGARTRIINHVCLLRQSLPSLACFRSRKTRHFVSFYPPPSWGNAECQVSSTV